MNIFDDYGNFIEEYEDLINKPTLSTVATSGKYEDLLGKPNLSTVATSGDYNDLSNTSWEISYEGKAFQGGYYDENEEYVTTGGRDIISYVKDFGTSYQKYMHVDKETGITYGYEDLGTYYRTTFIMRTYKAIVSPEEYEKLDDAEKSVVYSYGDIEKDIKSLCSKRTLFNNFTLTLPETTNAFRLLFSDSFDCVGISGSDVNVYNNSAYVYNSGSPITFTWEGKEGIVFDRYEIWDFVNQKWVVLSESPNYTFNTLEKFNCGIVVNEEHPLNILIVLITLEVSNCGIEVSLEQLMNIFVISVSFWIRV